MAPPIRRVSPACLYFFSTVCGLFHWFFLVKMMMMMMVLCEWVEPTEWMSVPVHFSFCSCSFSTLFLDVLCGSSIKPVGINEYIARNNSLSFLLCSSVQRMFLHEMLKCQVHHYNIVLENGTETHHCIIIIIIVSCVACWVNWKQENKCVILTLVNLNLRRKRDEMMTMIITMNDCVLFARKEWWNCVQMQFDLCEEPLNNKKLLMNLNISIWKCMHAA